MARAARDDSRLDAPKGVRQPLLRRRPSRDRFGRITESIARGMGTPWFLVGLTLFCIAWMIYNTLGPEQWRFDSAALGFTALTLILSLQASYAAPLILLAQNRQADRDRVQAEEDRLTAARNQAEIEYLTREIASIRMALAELATRDYLRSELQHLVEELRDRLPERVPDRRGG